jgi:hypothetical protein
MSMKALRLLAILVVVVAPPVLAAATVLTPTEIKTMFGGGKPFMATSTSGQSYTFTFKTDGNATQLAKGATTPTTGKWHVNDKGYCSKWGTSAEHCYTVEKNGEKFDVRDSSGKAISRWTLLP